MKKLLLLFVFSALLFACKTEKKVEKEDTSVEDLQKAIEEENTVDLASFEYVCDHCKIGSQEAGTCPCGMEFVKNAEFKMAIDEHNHENHDEDHAMCECPHCKEGTCTAKEGECKCTDACKMKKQKKEEADS